MPKPSAKKARKLSKIKAANRTRPQVRTKADSKLNSKVRKSAGRHQSLAGLTIQSHFLKAGQDPYAAFEWQKRSSEIRTEGGEIVFSMPSVEAPAAWSQMAVDITASKYFRGQGQHKETSVRQLVKRVVDTLAKRGRSLFASPRDQNIFSAELAYILLSQRASFNSPVWFNCGLWDQYRMTNDSESYQWSAKQNKTLSVSNALEAPQCSACFIQSVKDSLEGIYDLLKSEARLFKFGSGSGTNFSNLRAKNEALSGGGTSSGVMAFLEVFDRSAGATKSGGITRRAAKMVVLDCDHPEIIDFINWKAREEKKATVLLAAGFSAGMDGEAYHTVSGQNSNNSVRVSDAFMSALEAHGQWALRARKDGRVMAEHPADFIWQEMAQAAWESADPGVHFSDTIERWNTVKKSGAIRASNPCSEFVFLDESACNLASINLAKFVDGHGDFAVESFLHTVRTLIIAQEILVEISGYPTERIARNTHDFRPLGLGFANLGGALMRQGIAYDSALGRQWAGLVAALMTGQAFATSAELARVCGPFKEYKKNRSSYLEVVKNHFRHVNFLLQTPASSLGQMAQASQVIWQNAIEQVKKSGARHAQLTLIAPTGTIGLMMDCDTMGIEPEFALVKHKSLAGGGSLAMINHGVVVGLKALGYTEAQIKRISAHLEKTSSLIGAPEFKVEHAAVFDCAQGGSPDERALSPSAHLLMMAAVQPFLSGAISKTVNMPQNSKPEDIASIYYQAWLLGLKAVAVYRDGSKGGQPLTAGHAPFAAPLAAQSKGAAAANLDSFANCGFCGGATLQVGRCFVCQNCGETTGCV